LIYLFIYFSLFIIKIELIRAAKILATKPADKSASTQSYLEAFKALHATLNLNVDDLEDVVGIGANKIEGIYQFNWNKSNEKKKKKQK